MLKEERQEAICNELKKTGVVSIDALTKLLNTSRSTIRRDIEELETAKSLKRIRGGAVAVPSSNPSYEPSFSGRSDLHMDEKKRIAAAAKQLVHPQETLALASGTTVCEFAKTLRDIDPLYVATSDLMCAVEMSTFPNIELIVLGGSVRKKHYSLTGYFAEYTIQQIHADWAFLGVDAIDFNIGLMNFSPEDIAVNKLIIKASKQTVVLCDHTKFNTIAFANICPFTDVDILITGVETNPEYIHRLEEMGIQVIIV